jgi:hypothetical protein
VYVCEVEPQVASGAEAAWPGVLAAPLVDGFDGRELEEAREFLGGEENR